MNYKIGDRLWSSCKSKKERLVGGRPSINKETIEEIKSTAEKTSQTSSYRIVAVKKRILSPHKSLFEPRIKNIKLQEKLETEKTASTVLNRSKTLLEMKTNFDQNVDTKKKEEIQKISLTTFQKYVNREKIYKKPKNLYLINLIIISLS